MIPEQAMLVHSGKKQKSDYLRAQGWGEDWRWGSDENELWRGKRQLSRAMAMSDLKRNLGYIGVYVGQNLAHVHSMICTFLK